MKNLLSLLFILLSFSLTAQTFTTDQIATSNVGELSFQMMIKQTEIQIEGEKIKIISEEGVILLHTKEQVNTKTFDYLTYLIDGIYYEVKDNDLGIVKIELIPNDNEESLFGIVTITDEGKAVHYNHLAMQ